MQSYQLEFITLALECNALSFGEFTLKSGRISPYFFNAGAFKEGAALTKLGEFYAISITEAGLDFDILYGPAYKGIPIAIATVIAFQRLYNKNIPYAFNRKEAKDHGEGGNIVGTPLAGKVLIVDDVITAGTAIRESQQIISAAGAELAGVQVMLDRQERGQGAYSAVQEMQQAFSIAINSVINLDGLLDYLQAQQDNGALIKSMNDYRARYGV